jgi:predicted amidophosphoribosyltransferase
MIFRSVWVYDVIIRKLILEFKYNESVELADFFAPFLVGLIDKKDYLVTFVPSSVSRLWSRGYNQSLILANSVANIMERPVAGIFSKSGSANQKGKGVEDRLLNAFQYKIIDDRVISNQHVLIVDDVIASGSTMRYLALICSKKAKSVTCISIAKTYSGY